MGPNDDDICNSKPTSSQEVNCSNVPDQEHCEIFGDICKWDNNRCVKITSSSLQQCSSIAGIAACNGSYGCEYRDGKWVEVE